ITYNMNDKNEKTSAPRFFASGLFLKALIGLSSLVLLSLTVLWDNFFVKIPLKDGDVSGRNIVSEYAFEYADRQKTAKIKDEAMQSVPPVCIREVDVEASNLQKINSFFETLAGISADGAVAIEEKLAAAKSADIFELSDDEITLLMRKDNPYLVKESIVSALKDIYRAGVISMDDRFQIEKTGDYQKIRIMSGNTVEDRNIADIHVRAKIISDIKKIADKCFSDNRKIRDPAVKIFSVCIVPNIVYSAELTKEEKTKAALSVRPVVDQVPENTVLVKKGTIVTEKQIEMLKAYYKIAFTKEFLKGKYLVFLGKVAIVLMLIFAAGIYLREFQSDIFGNNKVLFMMEILFVLAGIIYKAVIYMGFSEFILPMAVISMTLAMLVNSRIALFTTLLASIFCALISGSMTVAFTGIIGGMVAITSVSGVRYRSGLIKAGLFTAVSMFMTVFAMETVWGTNIEESLKMAGIGFSSGMAAPFIVMGVLPFLETGFGLITNIHLLEMVDLNHPILRKMMIDAPGTYHHSLIVGNLSESAADKIRANSLLAKVGSYFHDIGKTIKPEYFSENESGIKSKHDELIPSMSNLIITAHVKDGIELAKKYKISRAIFDIIRQHHGTSLVYFFYKRAKDQSNAAGDVNEEAFRYPGPKPSSKEAAIVLLADAVEAASRTLEKPTPARIRNFINEIVDEKIIDGQLDECPLTIKDIEDIKDAFSIVLSGMFHTRVKYPKNEDRDNKSPKRES
ncbi:MAG: HDIG domain-containing protein, partial [bacterium]|nr:HDIG domain-containing protein [bacterium]